jgi:hypothetical protein
MSPARTSYAHDVRTPDPEEGLSRSEREIRRELLQSERPVATAAKLIAGLRAQLAVRDRKP